MEKQPVQCVLPFGGVGKPTDGPDDFESLDHIRRPTQGAINQRSGGLKISSFSQAEDGAHSHFGVGIVQCMDQA